MKNVLCLVIFASVLFCLDAAVVSNRVKRQFGFDGFRGFGGQFGPTGGPSFGPTGGAQFGQFGRGDPGFVQGNFVGFGPSGSQRRNNFGQPTRGGLTISDGRGNIIPRQVNNRPLRQQQQQTQPPQQQQQQTPQQPSRTSPAYRQCLAGCLTTNEYNPVCGSDQQVYFNEQRLVCANRCGMNVRSLRRGTCQATNNIIS